MYEVGDYVMIESKAWKKLGLDPDKPDFSLAEMHTLNPDVANDISPLMSFTEDKVKGIKFAEDALKRKEMPYGVLLIIERDEVKQLKKASLTVDNEKEWHVFGPVKARIVAFYPKMEANQMFFWYEYFKNK